MIAVQHTHVLVVILFLILFIVKAFLLFTNKHETLNKVKKSTKVLDIIFGTLIVATGGYLLFSYNGVPTWLIVKIILVLAAIPVAIIGIKKHNKPLTALGLIIFIYVYGVAESKSLTMKKENTVPAAETSQNSSISEEKPETAPENAPAIATEMNETALANAHSIYTQNCTNCHGADGRKGVGNATDLTTSQLPIDARKAVILDGKGLMPAFRGQISEQEAEELAVYTQTLN